MSRGCLISPREQDFTSVGGQPLLHDSLLMDSEEAAAATKTSTLCGHSIPQLPVSTEAGTLTAAFKVWGFYFVFVFSDFKYLENIYWENIIQRSVSTQQSF